MIATPFATGATDATDAVDVALRGGRHVVVDDMGERVDVEAAGRDIGGDQQLGGAVAQATHHPVALHLVHAAVECLGAVPAPVHRHRELVDLAACAAEHDRGRRRLDVEDAPEGSCLVGPLHDVGALTDQRLAGLRVALADLDPDRVALVPLRDRVDPRGQRRREEHGLALRRGRLQDRLEVVGEAHVEHLVGLVEHHDTDVVEWQGAAADVVDGPAGRGDDDVDAAVELLQLAVDRLPAVDRHDLHARGGGRT